MTPVLACMVCARPFDSLLTSGLHAGVVAMALVVVAVIVGLAGGLARVLREDRAELDARADGSGQ